MKKLKFNSLKLEKSSTKSQREIENFLLGNEKAKSKKIKFEVSKEASKDLDKLIAKYKAEKYLMLNFLFDSILERLKTEKKLDKILSK